MNLVLAQQRAELVQLRARRGKFRAQLLDLSGGSPAAPA
jgi:hypothetical protein